MTNDMEQEEGVSAPIKNPNIWGMINNPREQLNRIKHNPKFLISLIILTIITTIGMFFMVNMVTEDDLYVGMSNDEIFFMSIFMKIMSIMVGVFTPIIGVLISTVIYFVIAKIVSSDVSFKQLFSMSTHIYIFGALSLLINGIIMGTTGSGDADSMLTSLNAFVGATDMLGGFLAAFEIFTIWSLYVTAIGLHIVAGFSKNLTLGIVVVFFLFSLISSMLGGAATDFFDNMGLDDF